MEVVEFVEGELAVAEEAVDFAGEVLAEPASEAAVVEVEPAVEEVLVAFVEPVEAAAAIEAVVVHNSEVVAAAVGVVGIVEAVDFVEVFQLPQIGRVELLGGYSAAYSVELASDAPHHHRVVEEAY